MTKISILAIACALVLAFAAGSAYATRNIADQTGKSCGYCHVNPSGGGTLTPEGEYYLDNGTLPPEITGTIIPKDWAGTTAGMAATVDLRNGAGTILETKNVTLAANGGFSFATLQSGVSSAVAKAWHWLAKAMPVIFTGGNGSVSFQLTNGDCNGDNGIDEIDYALLSNAWYKAAGEPAYDPDADLNGDGGVDEIDYAILSNAWYTAGD